VFSETVSSVRYVQAWRIDKTTGEMYDYVCVLFFPAEGYVSERVG